MANTYNLGGQEEPKTGVAQTNNNAGAGLRPQDKAVVDSAGSGFGLRALSSSGGPSTSGGSSSSGGYNLGDDQYSKLGQDLYNAGNNADFYGQGWLNLSDYGGSDKYQFAYDDSQNIGTADQGDLSRWLYVRSAANPEQVQKYNMFNANNPNIDMAQLGKDVLSGGNNWLANFWNQNYGWGQQQQVGPPPVQPPTVVDQPPITPPTGPQEDQGAETLPGGGTRVPGSNLPAPLTPDDAVKVGMGGAKDAYENMLQMPQYYPKWWGEDYQSMDPSKWQNAYPEFLDVPQYQGVEMPGAYNPINSGDYPGYEKIAAQGDYTPITQGAYPGYQEINFDTQYQGIDPSQYKDYNRVDSLADYQGLMGKDYDRLETALRTPGEIAAQRGFQEGGNYLKDVMGSSGMYGSSVMGNQANNRLNQGYMDTLSGNAANAVAKRYGMQQDDLQFGANYDLGRAAQDISQSQFESQLGMNQIAQQLQDRQFGAQFGQNQDLARMNQNQFGAQFGLNKLQQQIQDSQFGAQFGLQNAAQQIQQNQFGSQFLQNQLQQQIQDNQFGANYGMQLANFGQREAMNDYNSSMTNRNLLNDYNNQRFMFDYGMDDAARSEHNSLLQNRFQYDLSSQSWMNALNERKMNAGLALAGQGAPLQAANMNYQLQQQAYNDAQNSGYWNAGFNVFDRIGGWDWAKNKVSGWFGG